MRDSIRVIDDFCPEIERVIQSVHGAGFGTWKPSKGAIGSSVYEGMGFWGDHSYMLRSLSIIEGTHVLPNALFFRITNPAMERAYIHSDRESAARTCIVFLSEHDERYGTAFWRHKATGLTAMPTFNDMQHPEFDQLKTDMVSGDESAWDQVDFVHGRKNRALIFDAPLFHSRIPMAGIGSTDENSRLVWACHFFTPNTFPKET
jgi:hypothetical protein